MMMNDDCILHTPDTGYRRESERCLLVVGRTSGQIYGSTDIYYSGDTTVEARATISAYRYSYIRTGYRYIRNPYIVQLAHPTSYAAPVRSLKSLKLAASKADKMTPTTDSYRNEVPCVG